MSLQSFQVAAKLACCSVTQLDVFFQCLGQNIFSATGTGLIRCRGRRGMQYPIETSATVDPLNGNTPVAIS
jgi:hypothetical protein